MPGGFGPRFAVEAGFLILLGVGAGMADLRSAVIVAVLAGGWALVSLIELGVWRAEGRTVALRMPPAPAVEPEHEPESEVGWPLEDPDGAVDESYPLRPDAELEGDGSDQAEAYTRILGVPESATSGDSDET
jgi:hypothetical protein